MSDPTKMVELDQLRCFNHVSREAVARCPECEQFYCRECVLDHDGTMICQSCLEKEAESPSDRSGLLRIVLGALSTCVSFILIWSVFFLLGKALNQIPEDFHENPTDFLEKVVNDE